MASPLGIPKPITLDQLLKIDMTPTLTDRLHQAWARATTVTKVAIVAVAAVSASYLYRKLRR